MLLFLLLLLFLFLFLFLLLVLLLLLLLLFLSLLELRGLFWDGEGCTPGLEEPAVRLCLLYLMTPGAIKPIGGGGGSGGGSGGVTAARLVWIDGWIDGCVVVGTIHTYIIHTYIPTE